MISMADVEGSSGFTSVNTPATQAVNTGAGTKRKRESKGGMKFYAVRIGKEPGIYHTWAECLDQVKGFPKAAFKSFSSLTEAEAFVKSDGTSNGNGKVEKWYGVQVGKKPGVYTSWSEVLEQITGQKGPKHKGFKTRSEAEQFVAEGQQNGTHSTTDAIADSIEATDSPVAPTKKAKTAKTAKKIKDENASPAPYIDPADFEPGEAPLPEDAEDGFDSSIVLDQSLGTARYKTAEERSRLKPQAVRPAKDSCIKIYTDGSSLGNGQDGAVGGIGVYFGPGDKRNISESLPGTRQTNQRAELTALMRALEVAPKDRKVEIVSDSNYAINCVTLWFQKWRDNGWVNASRKPVENKDLIQKIIDMLEERYRLNKHRVVDEDEAETDGSGGHWERGPASVKFSWVKGHAKDVGNNAADSLATAAAREAKLNGAGVETDGL